VPCVTSTEPGPPRLEADAVMDPELGTGTIQGRPRPIIGSYGPFVSIFGILAADHVIRWLISSSPGDGGTVSPGDSDTVSPGRQESRHLLTRIT
ncbi:hypothetical protein JXA80_04235, partial [bacterium]|nr:hypothetical protein [candidate division CSSED10-310 bacterium]